MRMDWRERLWVLLIVLALLFLAMMGFAGHSEADCRIRCLNRQVNALHLQYLPRRVARLEERLSAIESRNAALEARVAKLEGVDSGLTKFLRCTAEVPLSRYGEPTGPSGYLFELHRPDGISLLPTTALDLTYPNDPVDTWALVNSCNSDRVTPKSSLVRPGPEPRAHFDGLRTLDSGLH